MCIWIRRCDCYVQPFGIGTDAGMHWGRKLGVYWWFFGRLRPIIGPYGAEEVSNDAFRWRCHASIFTSGMWYERCCIKAHGTCHELSTFFSRTATNFIWCRIAILEHHRVEIYVLTQSPIGPAWFGQTRWWALWNIYAVVRRQITREAESRFETNRIQLERQLFHSGFILTGIEIRLGRVEGDLTNAS